MMPRRAVLPVLGLLVLGVVGAVLVIVSTPAASTPRPRPTPARTPPPTATTAPARRVLALLAAVERAYDAGDVRGLCRPGALVDPAVVRAQNAELNGCESELEAMMASIPRLRLTVRRLSVRPDLATAAVTTAAGNAASVDFVRRGDRWLLSFSDGEDPMPALLGTS
jgi:hypothetical protein